MKLPTQSQMAAVLKVEQPTVSKYMRGKLDLSVGQAIQLRDAFGIPIDAWLNIKQWLLDRKSMPDAAVHVQVEHENQLHQKESA
ncbi:MAG: helix-turn-helix domain-containing protein [Sulfuricurvum sp.]|uniref:helix-turn-helix domain-containing protein n=1 Tax=Sulfuricurvum sp. TaxID=2025608 RepID=UPI00261BD6B0|nr:helix-turn-helix domain-containing protein [Sulfuricurvum sp.]MDD5159666.1 helix-turn-helix domain-containing protein [Sulfuricurvum sp.]